MARTDLTVTDVTADGGVNLTDTLEAANADGEAIANADENVTLVVANGSGGSLTVTILTPASTDSLDIAEDTWTIADGKTYIGRFMKRNIYNQSTGKVHVNFSTVSSVTVAAFRITT